MTWQDQLKTDPLPWLLEPESPGVRYLAMRDLLDYPPDSSELHAACKAAHEDGPIARVLSRMQEEGYWAKAGPGYSPKYRSTQWSIILLAQLGALQSMDRRIARACQYLFEHGFTDGGQFSHSTAPSGTIDCLQGNLCCALLTLGVEDERLTRAFEWMARTVTGEGIAPVSDRNAPVRYYAYKCGALFACGPNGKLPCAWGAVKVMMAFSKWPPERRTPLIEQAIRQGADFLLNTDPATANYPTSLGGKPNRAWWKFGFPVFYITDILQIAEALVPLGYGHDSRLANALTLIRDKQNEQGRWLLEYDYQGKTWGHYGVKGEPNKWVTLRVLRVLKAVEG